MQSGSVAAAESHNPLYSSVRVQCFALTVSTLSHHARRNIVRPLIWHSCPFVHNRQWRCGHRH